MIKDVDSISKDFDLQKCALKQSDKQSNPSGE